jgi:phosphoesterase RecJ-like protein
VIDEQSWVRAIELLRSAQSPLLVAHVSPDADSLGSAIALAIGLRSVGIESTVSVGQPGLPLPLGLDSLPGIEYYVDADQIPEPDLVVTLDASSVDRLGTLGRFVETVTTIAVDHHKSYTGFADLPMVDHHAPATASIVRELLDRLGAPITSDIATNLYAGLLTDTGSFRLPMVDAQVHHQAGELLEAGADAEPARDLLDRVPANALRILGRALETAVLYPDEAAGNGVVITTISKADRDQYGLPINETERIVASLRAVDEADVAVVLRENDDATWIVSLRSRGAVDVSAVAGAFGGGGHRMAAGATSELGPTEILPTLFGLIEANLTNGKHGAERDSH